MPISTSRDSRYAAWVDVLAPGDLPDRLALVAPLDRPALLVRGWASVSRAWRPAETADVYLLAASEAQAGGRKAGQRHLL